MISNQIIQTSLEQIKAITKVDLIIYDMLGTLVASTMDDSDVKLDLIKAFANSPAESQVIGHSHLFKIYDDEDGDAVYLLLVRGMSDDAYMIGKLAVCQIQNLVVAYHEKYDKNTFFQNLMLDNLLLVDIYNKARKLHIEVSRLRVVFIIETKLEKDNIVTDVLNGMYSVRTGDFVTSVDSDSVILIKALENDSKENLQKIADTIVTMLNTDAFVNVRVAYGTVVSELKDVSKSYKEAKMALDVGKIFYVEKNVVSYGNLGIGRLIYQLPVNLCKIFIQEIFGKNIYEEFDDETLSTLDKFFENNLNVSQTSRQMFLHRNTLVYRIEKIQKVTGLDLRNFDDALTFKIALMVLNYVNFKEKE